MLDNAGKFYIINDVVEDAEKGLAINSHKDKVVYEVIRIIDRVPLFMEDHYVRLKNSLNMLGSDLAITQKELRAKIEKLVDINRQRNCNVKITVYHEEEAQDLLLHISKSYYPSREEILNGVKVGLMHWQRTNPNVKIVNAEYKEQAARLIKEGNVFEVLLVNSDNRITEGSKSNVFFVKGSRVFTSPDEYVLKGVTRKYIIDTCRKAGFELIETLVSLDSLKDIEGLFISGTSIKVLPVSEVEGYSFKSSTHPTIEAIRDQYDRLVEEYIRKNI